MPGRVGDSGDRPELNEQLLRWVVFVQGLNQPLSDLLSGLTRKLLRPCLIRATGEFSARLAQELDLGGIAAAPNATEQVNADRQALIPGKLGIHSFRNQSRYLPAIQHSLGSLLCARVVFV